MAASPRRPTPPFTRVTAVASALGCAPAWAAGEGFTTAALWFSLGVIVALAVAMALSWRVLRERVAPGSRWSVFFIAAVLVLLLGALLSARWPLLALLPALVVGGWGLWLVDHLAKRMRRLLDERDHARAEATRARQDSERDALTGVLNRGALRKRLERLAQETASDGRPLSLLYFDIDLFKLINDSLGHGVGDDCLKAVAATVAHELRGGDMLGRLGGEEFAVVLPGARRIHAIAVAERIRMAVQNGCRVVGEEVVEITVSLGAAEYLGESEAIDALMDRADRAMYKAKDSGRNMVVADPGTQAAN